jgi:hypothetical protein
VHGIVRGNEQAGVQVHLYQNKQVQLADQQNQPAIASASKVEVTQLPITSRQ